MTTKTKRKAFFSFHFANDSWRAAQVRNMGVIEGNAPVNDNDWEEVKKGGDAGIKKWIDAQMKGKSVVVVLIGSQTAGRKWIEYEIQKGWQDKKGVLGVRIHGLKNQHGKTSRKGENPFSALQLRGKPFGDIVSTYYSPYGKDSKEVYDDIEENLAAWIEKAIEIRGRYA